MDEREFELINIIGAQLASSQRDLSERMDLSLGMTNMLIRRMVSKGYIRIKQLDQRKVQYLLTPKGFSEKVQKSVKYTLKTINSIGLIKDNVKMIVQRIYGEGHRHFYVLGESDFTVLLEAAFREMALVDCQATFIRELAECPTGGFLLVCRENAQTHGYAPSLDLLQELAKQPVMGK